MRRYFAYCRVSTDSQSTDRQKLLINEYCKSRGIEIYKWVEDEISGKTFKRKNYQAMKQELQSDDVIIVSELDRLSRAYKSSSENKYDTIKAEWKELSDNGIRVVVIDMPLLSTDTDIEQTLDMSFIQNLVFEVLSYVANKEREKTSFRTINGIRAKREADPNFKIGREKTYADNLRHQVIAHYNSGHTMQECAEKFGVSTSSVHRFVKENKNG